MCSSDLADRATLVAAAEGVEKRLQEAVPKLDADAVTAMTKAGLTVKADRPRVAQAVRQPREDDARGAGAA